MKEKSKAVIPALRAAVMLLFSWAGYQTFVRAAYYHHLEVDKAAEAFHLVLFIWIILAMGAIWETRK